MLRQEVAAAALAPLAAVTSTAPQKQLPLCTTWSLMEFSSGAGTQRRAMGQVVIHAIFPLTHELHVKVGGE